MNGPFERAIRREADAIEQTAAIAQAFVGHNTIAVSDLPGLIRGIHGALASLGQPEPEEKVGPQPAVNPKRSVRPDAIVSLIDGKPYKMLRRHLSMHGYTPESYREAFGLAPNYPMVAADYAKKRRDLAIASGLGHHR